MKASPINSFEIKLLRVTQFFGCQSSQGQKNFFALNPMESCLTKVGWFVGLLERCLALITGQIFLQLRSNFRIKYLTPIKSLRTNITFSRQGEKRLYVIESRNESIFDNSIKLWFSIAVSVIQTSYTSAEAL